MPENVSDSDFKLVTNHSNAKPKQKRITFGTQVKAADLNELSIIRSRRKDGYVRLQLFLDIDSTKSFQAIKRFLGPIVFFKKVGK